MENPMQISLSPKHRAVPTLLIFAAIALMTSVMSTLLLGEIIIPVAAAALAAVFLLERGRARVFSIVTPVLMIAADVLCRGVLSYLAIEITLLAIILAIFFLRGAKCECAFWLTLTAALFVVVSMVLASYVATKQLSVDAFLDYYIGIYDVALEGFTEIFKETSILFGIPSDKADPAMASAILESIASLLPSVAIIFCFAIAGLSLKLLSSMLSLVVSEESRKFISAWRFALPAIIYYSFWVALAVDFLLGIFGASGIFAVAVSNVYTVLLYVFAYVGLGVVVTMLSALFKSRPLAILATIGTFVVFGALAVELVAYFGAAIVFFGRPGRDTEN